MGYSRSVTGSQALGILIYILRELIAEHLPPVGNCVRPVLLRQCLARPPLAIFKSMHEGLEVVALPVPGNVMAQQRVFDMRGGAVRAAIYWNVIGVEVVDELI